MYYGAIKCSSEITTYRKELETKTETKNKTTGRKE